MGRGGIGHVSDRSASPPPPSGIIWGGWAGGEAPPPKKQLPPNPSGTLKVTKVAMRGDGKNNKNSKKIGIKMTIFAINSSKIKTVQIR